MYLLFDTETTGLLQDNPHIVQLAALLLDSDYQLAGEMNVLIKPAGWIIPDHLVKVHGITTEKAERYGVPIASALSLFEALERKAHVVVAHNLSFDWSVLNLEYKRIGQQDRRKGKHSFCTMLESMDLVRIPSPYEGLGYKWPTLIEAYRFFFNEDFSGAHDAKNDLLACLRVFKYLQASINRSPFSYKGNEIFINWFKERLR